MRSIWGVVKLAVVILHACAQLVVRRPSTRAARALWLHQLCRRAVRIFGVEVRARGEFPERGFLISNHLSYVDIVVFSSLRPCVFVSKAEIESWPVLGWMTTMAGTVYVQRGQRGSAKAAGGGMRTVAESGLPVVFFPEGTTSNGDAILKFHSGLLMEALAGEQPVTAAHLRYSLTADNGALKASESVAWGEQPILSHMFRFLGLRGVRAEVAIATAPIRFTTAAASRKQAAVEARQAVCLLSEACGAIDDAVEAIG